MIAFTVLGSGWGALALSPIVVRLTSRRFAAGLLVAILTQATVVWCLKACVGRVRPWIALGLAAPPGAPHDGSFPSGHAAGSFCVAAFLAVALPVELPASPRRARAIAAAVGVLASFVASSRVYLGAHFPGDVVAGAVLGGAIGALTAVGCVRGAPAGQKVETEDGPMERAPERG
jgi:undecaprenyl-diphosphatase